MKKSIEIVSLLIISSFTLTGQKILFKPELKPNSTYYTLQENSTTTEVTYKGSEEFIEKLKEKGVTSPSMSSSKFLMKSRMQSFELQKNNRMRMQTEFIEIKSSGRDSLVNALLGIKIYATGDKDLNIIVDSITGTTNQDLKASVAQVTAQLSVKSIYPAKKIKLGKSFEKTAPFKYAISSDKSILAQVINTYRLDTIEKAFAVFHIDQKIIMDMTVNDQDINVHGSGSGRIVYDLVNKTNRLYQTELEFDYEWQIQDISITAKSITFSKTETLVE